MVVNKVSIVIRELCFRAWKRFPPRYIPLLIAITNIQFRLNLIIALRDAG
jgi:hypothetical protein